jgi:hypothetical protein
MLLEYLVDLAGIGNPSQYRLSVARGNQVVQFAQIGNEIDADQSRDGENE